MTKSSAGWGKEIIDLQLQWLGKIAAFFPENGRNSFNTWSVFFDQEVKPLLNAPQVGLARYYQERSNQLMEKFNDWNRSWFEFLSMVSVPLGESLCAIRRASESGGRAGLADECRSLYQAWIRQLDFLYRDLLRSPDFLECLSNTMEALEGFIKARTEYVEDVARAFQLPTLKDLDEAYRELYLLKKEIRGMRSERKARRGRREKAASSFSRRPEAMVSR